MRAVYLPTGVVLWQPFATDFKPFQALQLLIHGDRPLAADALPTMPLH